VKALRRHVHRQHDGLRRRGDRHVAARLGRLAGHGRPPPRRTFARKSGEAVVELLRRGITARDIMTKEAFENAIAVVMALGGSTNAVLHLLAIAHEADVDLSSSPTSTASAPRCRTSPTSSPSASTT
jgi:hypothetical protein